MKRINTATLALAASLVAAHARAQSTSPADELSLQELLDVEVVSAVSKFAQETTKAPASITIVDAEEIRRFGYRSLGDILRSVRGLYLTDDRNYSYVGVRGFGRPGDYNTRVLLLVDGHRLNDPIYDMAPIDGELPVDVETIHRVEVIRGPGSALYGTNAFFAVINIVTKSGAQERGVRVDTEGGTLDAFRGRASIGHVFGNGVDVLVGGSTQRVGGPGELYFPEFDSPDLGGGIVRDGDADRASRAFGAVSVGPLVFRGGFSERTKDVPTAAFDTVFGDRRFRTLDARGYADLSYTGPFAGGWGGVARFSYDRYEYDGWYPYDYGADGIQVFEDTARSDWLTTELTANRRVRRRHLVTAGVEARSMLRAKQAWIDFGAVSAIPDDTSTAWGAYLQDEFTLASTIAVSGGFRVDEDGSFGTRVTPRVALVYNPAASTALKAMHGRAFRAPNAYERFYYSDGIDGPDSLEPETIDTSEAVWEQYYGRHVKSAVSAFHSEVNDLITQTRDSDDDFPFANRGGAHSIGIESEVEARLPGGIMTRTGYTWTRAIDDETGARLSNSPLHMAKYNVAAPIGRSRFSLASNGSYIGSRQTVRGGELPGVYLQNVTLTGDRLIGGMDLSLGLYNVFDRNYGDPGAEEHVQEQIPQDGRSLRARLTMRF